MYLTSNREKYPVPNSVKCDYLTMEHEWGKLETVC
jgi:hypothetical protein